MVWQNHLGAPVTGGWLCGNVSPQGILGTPVIDVVGGRIYVAALFNSDHLYRVFGLDLLSGNVALTTVIPASIGSGFDWKIQQERGGLAVANGYVYVPFGGRAGDCFDGSTPYHGWVVGVPTSGAASLKVFETPSSAEGIWAAGGVVVDDTTGNVFVATGNAIPCSGASMSDSIVRLSPTLGSPSFFQPNDWQSSWCGPDSDLGSASPLLISPTLMFMAGKHGGGFLLDPTNLGGVDGQLFPTPKPATYSQADVCFGNTSGATFGSFAYLAPFAYIECEGRGLVALNVNPSTPSFTPCDAACPAPNWTAGSGITFGPPIVAAGAVWAASDGGGLYAFDATTGAQLYKSAGFGINRFVTPAEAGGQVFVPSHTVIKSFSFASPPPPAAYTAVTPGRITDTRAGSGQPNAGKTLGAGATVDVQVTGAGGVPATGVSAAILNITATNTTAASYLTVYPAGSTRPLASNLNWVAGKTVPNLVEAPLGAGGAVTIYNGAGSTDVVADVEGYFAPPSGTAGGEVALTPARIHDTRTSGSTVGTGGTLSVQVTGAGGVPATGASAVILNVTVTNTTAQSYLTAWPQCNSRPVASNLNWLPSQTVPNRVIVPVCPSGQISFYNAAGSTDIVVDVSGYFTDSTAAGKFFVPQNPIRIKDTRSSAQTLNAGGMLTLQVGGARGVPATATAVILNVTVTNTTAPSYLTVWPSTAPRPLASDLNWVGGQTVPNLAVATLGTSGAISIYNAAGSTDVVVDVFGYFN
jgi:hypothetical protein